MHVDVYKCRVTTNDVVSFCTMYNVYAYVLIIKLWFLLENTTQTMACPIAGHK